MISEEHIQAYLKARPALRSEATIRNHTSIIRRLSATSHKTLADLIEFCITPAAGNGTVSRGTIQQRSKVLVGFFNWCEEEGYVKDNPSTNLRRDLPQGAPGSRRHNWLSTLQVKKLLARPDVDDRERIIILFGCHAGLRVSEICNLTWDDVDLPERQMYVFGKHEKMSAVGLSDGLTEALRLWKAEAVKQFGNRGMGRIRVIPRYSQLDWRRKVIDWSEKTISTTTIRKIVQQAGWDIGVDALTPHDLRRTLAGILDRRDVPIGRISEILRHSSIETTQGYLEANPHRGIKLLKEFTL